jgi:hypothetical protein
MTTELITGFADTPHIDAADDGALNAGILGNDNYVVQGGNQFAAVMRDANHITISTGEAVMAGRHVRVTSAEDVTIASGSQGLKRHDIVGFRYSRDSSTSVETAVLDVIRGTASSTPADPALPTGNILTGASSAFMPLYRVPLDGITVGTPVPLFNVLRPMAELWDSVTHTQEALFKPQNATSFQMLNPSRITVRGGYIYLDLGSFKSTVGVNNFPIYQYSSGVKPSAAIDLGAIGVLAGAYYSKTGRWNTDGSITVGPSVSANDYLITLPRVIPVPAGVTFS